MNINRYTLRLYWEQVRNHKLSFWLMFFCIPFGALLISTISPYFLSLAIGHLSTDDQQLVNQSLILAGVFGLIGVTLNFVGFQAMARHEASTITRLRNQTFQTLLSKDLQFFIDEKIGALTSKYIDFVRAHITIQDLLIIRTIGFVMALIVGLFIIGAQSLLVAGLILFLFVALVAEVRWSIKKREPHREKRKILRSEIHGKVADDLTNSLVVKTFAGEKRELRSITTLGQEFSTAYLKEFSFIGAEGSARLLIMIVVQTLAIAISSWLVLSGQVEIPTVVFCLTYLQLVGTQIFSIGDLLNGYEEALLEASPMTKLLLYENKVTDPITPRQLTVTTPTITLDDISYHYPETKQPVIDGVTLTIPAGQKIGLVGHSGAGKTTLTHLLLRFSDVTSGAIMIDGTDIREVAQDELRHHIAYVPQEPLLFHRTLRENIAYGKPDATDKEIRSAAKRANALEFIDKLPHGLDTLVGERGVKLSGGQRQRIAIARAILKDAPVLILDEATSALDSESEKLIQDALGKLMKGRTSIVIAHRLSTIAKLDRIIILDKGLIREDGTHAELLKQKGIYASLWNHQSGGFIED